MKPSQKLTLGRILVSKNKAIGDTRYTDRLGSTFTTVFFVIKRRITAICSAKGRERERDFVFSAWTLSSAWDGWVLHLSGMLWWCDKVLWHWMSGYPSKNASGPSTICQIRSRLVFHRLWARTSKPPLVCSTFLHKILVKSRISQLNCYGLTETPLLAGMRSREAQSQSMAPKHLLI